MKEMRCLHCYSNEFSERNGHLYCVYCGSKYRQRPEDQEILLSMAYRELRFMNFLDAENAFEDIISRHPDLPEAYWGCVCARYGIKFEQDYTGRQIPTCCLPAIESILEDRYYQKAVELSDEETAAWYSKQGEYLERVRKTWIERARKLAPYDVFISYKDSDQEKGLDRTEDSLKAQSIYTHLVTQGYSVFYSRESLSNVIGEKYEPYIFQALSTSRAMIVYGSTPEYINSTWVRNEWQRYAKKMQKGEKDKGSLIVICDGFSPKDLPPMLRSMQVLDGRDMFCYSKLDEHLKGLLAKKVSPEEEAKKKAEEEARKRAEAKAEAKRRAVAEAKRKAEETAIQKGNIEKSSTKKSVTASRRRAAIGVTVGVSLLFLVILAIVIFPSMFGNTSVQTEEQVMVYWDTQMPVGDETESQAVPTEDPATSETETQEPNTEVLASEGLAFASNGDGTCSVSGMGSCRDTDVVIPRMSPAGDSVTSIGNKAFDGCSNLTSIEIPDSVTRIGYYAFRGCNGLTSIVIPDNVTNIGDSAFYGCNNLEYLTLPYLDTYLGSKFGAKNYSTNGDYISKSLKVVVITGGTSIGSYAFSGCSSLTSIKIPDSVTSIDNYAFAYCNSLTKLEIPNSVANIGDCAFYDCEKLTSITIPVSVTSIGVSAFEDCSSLTSVIYRGNKRQWDIISKASHWKFSIPSTAKIVCTDGTISISES